MLEPLRVVNGNFLGTPLYKEVRRYILERLTRGDWKPGERIPPETELAKHLSVGISTVRAGIKDLTVAGLLIRRQGMGTFVTQHDYQSQQFRFSNIYNDKHKKILTNREILSMRRIRANRDIAQVLQLKNRDAVHVYAVSALLKIADHPIALMELLLPAWLFPRLVIENLRQTQENLYSVYQRMHEVTIVRMDERVSAREAEPDFVRLVGAREGEPVLHVQRVAYTFNNVPAEMRCRTYKASGYHYLFSHKALE